MLVLRSQDELQVLKKELRSCFPESLKVYGAVLNVSQGNVFNQDVVVDSWPNFQVVIARPQKEKMPPGTNYFAQSCAVFYKDLSAYEKLVKETDAIDWKQEFLLHGLQRGVYQTSRDIAAAKGFSVKLVTETQVFVLQDPLHLSATVAMNRHNLGFLSYKLKLYSKLMQQLKHANGAVDNFSYLVFGEKYQTKSNTRLRSGSKLKLASLEISHAALLNETWSVGGKEHSLLYLTRLIHCFPSSCLLDAEGCPVSWVLLDQFGCLTHAYTMPAHRGKGYIQVVMVDLAKKLETMGYPVYGDVLKNNTAMRRALQQLGDNFTPCFLFYDLHTPRNSAETDSSTVQPVKTL